MSWGRTSRISKYKCLEVPVNFKEWQSVERALLEWNRQGRRKQGMKLEKQWARAEHEGLYRNFRSWAFTKNVIGRFLSRRVTLSDLCFISITLTCVLRRAWMVWKMEDGKLVGRLLQWFRWEAVVVIVEVMRSGQILDICWWLSWQVRCGEWEEEKHQGWLSGFGLSNWGKVEEAQGLAVGRYKEEVRSSVLDLLNWDVY